MFALVTADAADGLDPDLGPLADDLVARLGADAVRVVSWDDPGVDWSSLDAAIIRSTWDYTERLDEFLAWAERVAAVTRLVNDVELIRWNTDKHYLADLAAEGIPITPTAFVAPGESAPVVGRAAQSLNGDHRSTGDITVVKPTVGAGSAGARRCSPGEVDEHVAFLHASGRTAMVQPYLDGIDSFGETALCFVAGPDGELCFSHAFRKGAILTSSDVEQVGDLFAKEDIGPREPTAAELALARRVLASSAVRDRGAPFFGRVDLAPHGGDGRDDPHALVLMELELVEPSFYFEVDSAAAERFGEAVAARLGSARSGSH